MESVWEKDLLRVRFDTLEGKKSTEVLIIGGGIAGILCAYKLKNAGVDCMLVEATEICGGITKNTTAKITLGHGLIYDKMIKRFGEDKARLYAEAQMGAIKEYARLCESIDCDYETRDNYVYSLSDRKKIEKVYAVDQDKCKKCGAIRRNRTAHEAKIQPDDLRLIIRLTVADF